MKGYWIELFSPRTSADVTRFLPENVEFISHTRVAEVPAILAEARAGNARVLLECPSEYPGVEFGCERYAESFKAARCWFESVATSPVVCHFGTILFPLGCSALIISAMIFCNRIWD